MVTSTSKEEAARRKEVARVEGWVVAVERAERRPLGAGAGEEDGRAVDNGERRVEWTEKERKGDGARAPTSQ